MVSLMYSVDYCAVGLVALVPWPLVNWTLRKDEHFGMVRQGLRAFRGRSDDYIIQPRQAWISMLTAVLRTMLCGWGD